MDKMDPDPNPFLVPVPDPIRSPNYMSTFSFERNFDLHGWRIWMSRHWSLSLHMALAYIVLVHLGKIWMKPRRPYKFQYILTLWNVALAAFSLAGFLRSLPEVLNVIEDKSRPGQEQGAFFELVCSRQGYNAASAFWALAGTFSKVVEFGDTLFIILRKQPLIFLNWYHHATVMLYTWYTYDSQDPCHRLFIVMNYFEHAVMYSYYALRAMGVKLPKSIAMAVTSMQLVQMVAGCGINAYSYYTLKGPSRPDCVRLEKNVMLATAMYFSYFILFAQLFYNNYILPKPGAKIRSSHNQNQNKKKSH